MATLYFGEDRDARRFDTDDAAGNGRNRCCRAGRGCACGKRCFQAWRFRDCLAGVEARSAESEPSPSGLLGTAAAAYARRSCVAGPGADEVSLSREHAARCVGGRLWHAIRSRHTGNRDLAQRLSRIARA